MARIRGGLRKVGPRQDGDEAAADLENGDTLGIGAESWAAAQQWPAPIESVGRTESRPSSKARSIRAEWQGSNRPQHFARKPRRSCLRA